jgi:hypothetical protein
MVARSQLMVTPVVSPSRHQLLLPLGWPVDGASCQASAYYARECVSSLGMLGEKEWEEEWKDREG